MTTQTLTAIGKEPKSVDFISYLLIKTLRTAYRGIQDSDLCDDEKAFYRVAIGKHASRIGFDAMDLNVSDETFNANYKQGEL